MGLGDLKYSASIGLITGYFGVWMAYSSVMLSFFIGSVYGLTLMALKKGGRKTEVPFGPFMFAGAYLAILGSLFI